jgi:signal transduction histidine kinase/DNA-binding response OmpR family regulator
MKRFYLIFFLAGTVIVALLNYATWGFPAIAAAGMLFIAYRFYMTRLQGAEDRNAALEEQVEELHERLDSSILKEQRIKLEAQEAKDFRQQLLTTMSHEIRTPLNGVMGMATLLAETPLSKEQQGYTETIRNCGENLLATVNQIIVDSMLNFSKSDNEKKKLENKEFDLRNCLEEVLDMFAGRAGQAGLDLLYNMEDNVPEQIIGDPNRLRQILMNLVENALRFTSRGEISVGVYLLRTGEDNKLELCFDVRDTGVGIPANRIEEIFKGFSTAGSPDGGKQGNAGLGLVICKKLVEMMEGWIEVQSEPGKGTVFTFCIHVHPSQKPARNFLHPGMAVLEGKHILVVEGNTAGLAMLSKQLEKWKSVPVPVGSASRALDMLSGGSRFDGVMDLPEMDGIQLTKSIRELNPHIPVILLIREGDERHKQEEDLFSGLLTKPVKQHLFRDELLSVFSRSGMNPGDGKKIAENLLQDFSKEHPLHLLIAEDNPVNQEIALKILNRLGYRPEVVNNGKEVLEKVSHENYDMILMDMQMPEMDGLEATRMLRLCLEIQPVIIAMTANVMQGDRDDCIQAGMDDYISKPIELAELTAQLRKWSRVIKSKRPVA